MSLLRHHYPLMDRKEGKLADKTARSENLGSWKQNCPANKRKTQRQKPTNQPTNKSILQPHTCSLIYEKPISKTTKNKCASSRYIVKILSPRGERKLCEQFTSTIRCLNSGLFSTNIFHSGSVGISVYWYVKYMCLYFISILKHQCFLLTPLGDYIIDPQLILKIRKLKFNEEKEITRGHSSRGGCEPRLVYHMVMLTGLHLMCKVT